jgi:peptidoglycan hydrolase CwlO-like protein
MLDTDIEKATKKVNKTNSDIIKTKAEIDVNSKEIDELKQKVEENTEILLQYLIYIYKKTNTAYS